MPTRGRFGRDGVDNLLAGKFAGGHQSDLKQLGIFRAQLLYQEVEVNHPVPDKSYAAVAEVLAYVYQLKGKKLPMPPGRAA